MKTGMKKVMLMSLMALVATMMTSCMSIGINNDRDNTPTQVHEINQVTVMQPFNDVDIVGPFKIIYEQGEQHTVRIEASEQELNEMTVYVKEKELRIRKSVAKPTVSLDHVKVYVTSPDIQKIDLAGSGVFAASNPITASDNLDALNKCDIPRYIYYIGVLSFAYCESLTSFTIPKPVKRDWIESVGLENGVFFGCKNLTEIYLPEKMHDLMSYNFPYSRDPFANCPSLKTIYVPAGAKQKILNIFGSKYDQLVVEISKQEQAQEASRHQDSSTQNVEHYESPMVVYKHKLSITGKLMSFFKSLIKKK